MQQQNKDFFPWDEKSAQDEWFPGIYHVKVIFAEDGIGSNSGKRMPRVGFQCLLPTEYVHLSHFENYVVGTDEAPTEIVKGSMGFSNLMKLAMKAQIPPTNDIVQLMVSLMGVELLIAVSYKPATEFPNNVVGYYKLGERAVEVKPPPMLQGAVGAGPPALGQAVSPAPPVQAPAQTPQPMPTGFQGPQADAPPATQPAVQPTQEVVQPAAPVTQPVEQPAVTPVQTPATGVPAPQPVQTPAPPTQPPVEQPVQTGAPPEPNMRCTICQQDVPVSQFGAHVQAHASGQT